MAAVGNRWRRETLGIAHSTVAAFASQTVGAFALESDSARSYRAALGARFRVAQGQRQFVARLAVGNVSAAVLCAASHDTAH